MAFCPNCGTQYDALPLRCQCGYLFGSGIPLAIPPVALAPASRFEFRGDGAGLIVLYLKLIVFSILTLGIYSFWGRTAIRRYLWSKLYFAGQPFAYHGTAKELLVGWLKLIGLMAVLYGAIFGAAVFLGENGTRLGVVVIYVVLLLLMPLAIHGALRYRFSRTSWQGRRFTYEGELLKLAGVFWGGAILTLITLSLYLPFFLNDMRRYVLNHTSFAGQRFEFRGEGRAMLWPYVKMLLLFLPTLSLYRFWFHARQANYYWSQTSFAGVPFRSSYTGQGWFVLGLTNYLLTYFTLGIGYPWAVCRQIRFVFDHLELDRLPDVQLSAGGAPQGEAFGDQLGQALGTDAGIDAGFGL